MSATTADPISAPSQPGGLTHKQIMTILSGLMLGMFLAALDQTIVATAIRTIGDDLNGLSAQAWVTTAFLMTSTITTPLYGKLSDIYGRKPLFMTAITIFIAGSALCGLAQSMYMLAGFRAFQGLGAGGLMSLALAIIGDIIPPRERARYQGYFLATFASASVIGPVVGGFFAGQSSILGVAGWRWIFYINVPVAALALIVIQAVLKLDHTPRSHRIDWNGAGALVVALVPLLLIAEQGRLWGWGSTRAFACYVIGVGGIALFIRVEQKMGDDALIPLRLFRNGVFTLGSAQSTIIGMGMFGGIASLPLYLQIVKGASPTKSGLLILPLILGLMSASILAGQITSRTGRYKIFPVLGSFILVGALFAMTQIGADTPLWQTDLYMVAFGAGIGMNMQTIVLAMQNAVDPRDMGVATASTTFFRQIGATLGTAIFLSILFSSAGGNISSAYEKARGTDAFRAAAAAHPDQLSQVSGGGSLNDTNFLKGLDSVLAHPFRVGFSDAMDTVFLVGGFVLIIALVLSVFMKEVPLRTVSGQQARAEAEAAATATATATATSQGGISDEDDADAEGRHESGGVAPVSAAAHAPEHAAAGEGERASTTAR